MDAAPSGIDSGGAPPDPQLIKCVVWDLDNTVWDGVLLEDGTVHLRDHVAQIIRTLDDRGILQSIASKNDHQTVVAKLEELGLHEYFLHPQVNWHPKVLSIQAIAAALNIGLDTIAFVDDEAIERDEVVASLPEVRCIDAADAGLMLSVPALTPRFITEESRLRRVMYASDIERRAAEEGFVGSSGDFLATLDMRLTIAPAARDDLQRAEELTVRTNQLNSTGYTYSYEELDRFRDMAGYLLLVAGLEDRYGTYGTIGLALVERQSAIWTIKLLLMSCRVMSRGIGTILMSDIMTRARASGVRLRAEFVPNGRNRLMYLTYKCAGFRDIEVRDSIAILETDLTRIQPFPEYVKVNTRDAADPGRLM